MYVDLYQFIVNIKYLGKTDMPCENGYLYSYLCIITDSITKIEVILGNTFTFIVSFSKLLYQNEQNRNAYTGSRQYGGQKILTI